MWIKTHCLGAQIDQMLLSTLCAATLGFAASPANKCFTAFEYSALAEAARMMSCKRDLAELRENPAESLMCRARIESASSTQVLTTRNFSARISFSRWWFR